MISTGIEECSSLVQEALNEVGLKKVTVRKEVPPHYLLVEYSPGWVGKNLEIEFVFKETQNGTEVSIKWPYAEEVPPPMHNENLDLYKQREEERKQKIERLIGEFKKRIGATNIPLLEKRGRTS